MELEMELEGDLSAWSSISFLSDQKGEEQLPPDMIDVQREVLPEEAFPNMESWISRLRSVVGDQSPIQWEIGRLLVVGEQRFGKKAYREAELLTGYSRRTLYDLAWVVKHVSLRNEKLSWSHHKAIAHMAPERQTEWLQSAALGGLTVRDLRSSIRVQEPTSRDGIKPAEHLETERLLDLLAESRGVTVRELKRTIFGEYLTQPEIVDELGQARLTVKLTSTANRRRGRERWETWVARTVEDLLSRLEDYSTSTTDPSDFVNMWERETDRKFTRSVFVYAMRNTELRAHYAGMSSEDFGLDFDPALHARSSKQ